MKQCPVCEREFEDNMRFCQTDGTPLVDKTESVDPFKTMVASKDEIAAAMSSLPAEPVIEPTPEPVAPSTPEPSAPSMPEPSVPAPIENEVLEIPPAVDPNKTQFVSEAELRAEMDAHSSEEQVIDVPPLAEPELPKFVEPESVTPPPGVIGSAPPPSPFSTPNAPDTSEPGPANFPTSPPIPSPFNPVKADQEPQDRPVTPTPPFAEPPASPEPAVNPFAAPPAPIAQAEVSSPVLPESNMQNPQDFGNAQFNPPAAAGQSQTLAIVSLVVGILSLFCCWWFIPAIAALIVGFIAKSKASNDPANYGGAGLALGGIICGALSLVGGVIVIILYFLGFAASMMQGM